MEEAKSLSFEVTDSHLVIKVDPNKNGTPVVKLDIDLKEVPSEVLAVIKK